MKTLRILNSQRLFVCMAVVTGGQLTIVHTPTAAQSPSATSPDPTAGDNRSGVWTELFDGTSFSGWEGNLDTFRIEDGCIVGGSLAHPVARNEFLCTENTYDDFELKVKVRIKGEGANAGIQFRTQRIPDHHEVSGYQADVGQAWWGKLYDESRRRKILAGPSDSAATKMVVHDDGWNEYVIRCEGPRIQLWLNGIQTVDFTETEDVAVSGVIAVQIHGGPASEAWYRDIEIRPL